MDLTSLKSHAMSLFASFASSLGHVDKFASTDVPGKDVDVLSGAYTLYGGATHETESSFLDDDPQVCVNECLRTPWCHGFVTYGERCWYRGGLVTREGLFGTPTALLASQVPASDDYTLYVLYRTEASASMQDIMIASGAAALVLVLLLCICCCCCCRRKPAPPKVPFPVSKRASFGREVQTAMPKPSVPKPSTARAALLKKKYSFAKETGTAMV